MFQIVNENAYTPRPTSFSGLGAISPSTFNSQMAAVNSAFKSIDRLGWSNNCWRMMPLQRATFREQWAIFSEFYRSGSIPSWSSVQPIDEEGLREFQQTVRNWQNFFRTTCKAVAALSPAVRKELGFGGLGALPLIPFLIAGTSAATGATVASWLSTNWDVGTYNVITSKISDTLASWDAQGWKPNNCWGKYPAKRKEWLAFWSRWNKHYAQYGKQSGYLSDSAEMPVRNIFLPELAGWAEWFNKTCGVDTGGGIGPTPSPDNGETSTDIASMVKWGVIGIGAIVALNVVTGLRQAFPRQPR